MSRFNQTEEELKLLNALEKLRKLPDGTSATIPIEHIVLNQNIRSSIDKLSTEFLQLKESIKETGLLHPPVVTVQPDQIICIAGHRRIEALKDLGQTRTAVILRKLDEIETRTLAQLVENTARKDISPIDLANAVALAKKGNRYSATRLAELIGKERKYIERLVKISNWTAQAKSLAQKYKLNMKQLFAIASKKLTEPQILEEIENKGKGLGPKRSGAVTVRHNREKMIGYFEANGFDKEQKKLILNFLKDMKIKGWEIGSKI